MEGCGGEWFGAPVPRLFLFVGALHPIRRQCTSSVRVHRHITGAVPPCLWRLWRLSGLWGSSGLALSPAGGTSWCLCGVSCCGSSEMSHAIPPHVFQTLKSHRWNCNVFGRCRKFGYPNCMRVLVDEAPKVNSCVRSSSHDTVHDPRHASTTTPTPHNAKSLITYPYRRFLSACTARTNYRDKDRRTALFSARRARTQGIPARRTRR